MPSDFDAAATEGLKTAHGIDDKVRRIYDTQGGVYYRAMDVDDGMPYRTLGPESLTQKYLKRLLTKAARTSKRHTKQAQMRLDRISFMQPEQLQTIRALAKDTDELALPPHPHLTNADMHIPGLEW